MSSLSPKTLLFLVGTRPEAIKMAPLVLEAQRRTGIEPLLCATAQHRELMDEALKTFGLVPHCDLNLMLPGQSLAQLTAQMFERLPPLFEKHRPHVILVQGDTTTAFAGAAAAFYSGIPVGHVEAGLRTGDLRAPFPEEGNRKMISAIARWHFAPTSRAAENLLREGIAADQVHVTGNTGIDALHLVAERSREHRPGRITILVTAHRRESFGEGLRSLCMALARIADLHPDVELLYPVHPNPNVREPVEEILGRIKNVQLLPPLNYEQFVTHLSDCRFVITDSGGVQEEAPAFGKPVLVTRSVTERPEAVDAGCARLVGTDIGQIVSAASELLHDGPLYMQMSQARSPFGDGNAAARILDILTETDR